MTMTDRLAGINEGVAVKAPCACATTASISLSGLQTIDGVALAAGDRVLVKNQSSNVQNGIWVASSGAWSRAKDFNGARDVVQGTLVFVIGGTVNANTFYRLDTALPVIGSSALTFSFSMSGTIASQAQAEAGTNNTALMTPLRVREATTKVLTGGSFSGIYTNATNPTVPGWGVSFNSPTLPGYANGVSLTYTLTSASPYAVNGMLLNVIVDSTYNKDIVGTVTTTPVAVGANIEMQVNKANGGNDYWANVGVLDIQTVGTSNTGGQATAGIVRGNWTGTNIAAGLRSQAENYTGRAAYGVIVGSSQIDGTNAPFDNSYAYGVFVHSAKTYGMVVGGPTGALAANLPATPYAFLNADGTKTLWSIVNNSGTSATQTQNGQFTLFSDTAFPVLQMENRVASANNQKWQQLAAADGTWTLRTLNDAETVAVDAVKITRSGTTVGTVTVSAPLVASSHLRRNAPVEKSADFTLADTENYIVNSKAGSNCVVTLPAASGQTGREVTFKTTVAFAIVSASSNVVPRAGGAASTAITGSTAGNWATLVSDGTNWVAMAGS